MAIFCLLLVLSLFDTLGALASYDAKEVQRSFECTFAPLVTLLCLLRVSHKTLLGSWLLHFLRKEREVGKPAFQYKGENGKMTYRHV